MLTGDQKVVFIIPLKSKQVSTNWNLVLKLCRNTINSIYNQTNGNFLIYLICNIDQSPEFKDFDDRLRIIEDEFSIPKERSEYFLDQKLKIKRGLIATKKLVGNFFMRLDADDLVHKKLVDYILKNDHLNGWYIPIGYMYEIGSYHIYLRPNFHFCTASSHIVKLGKDDFPTDMDTPDSQYLVEFWQHLILKRKMSQIGRPLKPLPFKGATYVIGHDESVMQHKVKGFVGVKKYIWKLISKRTLTQSLKNEYTIN